jgi:monoamine oxidase
VRVLEARDRVGGRILTRRGRWPVPVELGAEFIQGHIPALVGLAHQRGLPVVELLGTRWQSRNDERTPVDDFGAGLSEGLAQLRSAEDMSFAQFLASAPSENRDQWRLWIQSYDAADPERVSALSLARERSAEATLDADHLFRLVTGYDGVPLALLDQLQSAGGHVELETIATDVQWTPHGVEVQARDPHGAAHGPFRARFGVIALPIGVLQGGILFTPSVPALDAARSGLEMGHVAKIVFAFQERFWTRSFPQELGFLIAPDEPFQGWWTGYPVHAPVLAAWAGGPAADALSAFDAGQRADRALASLARLLRVSQGEIERLLVTWETHDWANDPWARGAYSYVRVGGMPAQALLARPIENTLFFAGEATELAGHQATVHGALFAGERAAEAIIAARV